MPDITKIPIRIVILDNHTLVRAGIRLLIEGRPGMEVVGEAGNLGEGIEIVTNLKPDIILFESNLSDQLTSDIVSSLIKAYELAHLILVTEISDPQVLQHAIEVGVMGVVFKTQPPETLIKAIDKVYAGEVWIERSMIANVLSRLSRNNKPAKISTEADSLTQLSDREKDVVRLIGQGLKNKKISAQLCISETTVRHHLTSIYSKLGVSDRLELLIFAHRYGLVKSPNS
jgi:DNA-binding NarL/FixJ family response regulator